MYIDKTTDERVEIYRHVSLPPRTDHSSGRDLFTRCGLCSLRGRGGLGGAADLPEPLGGISGMSTEHLCEGLQESTREDDLETTN